MLRKILVRVGVIKRFVLIYLVRYEIFNYIIIIFVSVKVCDECVVLEYVICNKCVIFSYVFFKIYVK